MVTGVTGGGASVPVNNPEPEPNPAILEKWLENNVHWDIESANARLHDLYYQVDDSGAVSFVPLYGATIYKVSNPNMTLDTMTLEDLKRVVSTGVPMTGYSYDPWVDIGSLLVVRTSEGNYAKLQIIKFNMNTKEFIKFRYALYDY